MSRILVCGGSGFVGGHLINRLKKENHWIRSVDIKTPTYKHENTSDHFVKGDLRNFDIANAVCEDVDQIYQLAADMGGAGYIFSGDHDAKIMRNSLLCNVNILEGAKGHGVKKVLFSSSACIYPYFNQKNPNNPNCEESTAYPAMPDSEYGWEKLFSERIYAAYSRNFGMDCKIARLHNVYGPKGSWVGGKEKAPAAICRKVAEADFIDVIEIWGTGQQTRSFLYIDDCLDALTKLMNSDFNGPVNIGSEEMITINHLAEIVIQISKKEITLMHIDGPLGVNGRRSDNRLIREKLNWEPTVSLKDGLTQTYNWIQQQEQINKIDER